jgi:hypothetical protein
MEENLDREWWDRWLYDREQRIKIEKARSRHGKSN